MIGFHTSREWLDLLQSWGWRCFYCGNCIRIRFRTIGRPEHEATKDHVVPISRGGVDYIENIVPACLRCNRIKAKMTGEEFILSRPHLRVQKEIFPTGIDLVPYQRFSQDEKTEEIPMPNAPLTEAEWNAIKDEIKRLAEKMSLPHSARKSPQAVREELKEVLERKKQA